MKVIEFLLHETQVGELCVIRDGGWLVGTAWIDDEDLFRVSDKLAQLKVKGNSWGQIVVKDKNGERTYVPCHYIDC